MMIILTLLSFFIVAFGQPALIPFLGIFVASIGFGLFGICLLKIRSRKHRFLFAAAWFGCVQAVQLAWFLTHPYSYIYGLYLFLIVWMAIPFGIIGILIEPSNLKSVKKLLGIAGLWTLFEWGRLYFISGFPFNPIGLSLTSTLWGLQGASLAGVYGLSFLVICTNLLFLRIFVCEKKSTSILSFASLALFPYVYGGIHLAYHNEKLKQDPNKLNALLVQTAFPIEEQLPFTSFADSVAYVEDEWKHILETIAPFIKHDIDLIALPEYVVPYGTYVPIYPLSNVQKLVHQTLQQHPFRDLPPLALPLAIEKGSWYVTNAYICQTISNLFKADLVVGLQDDQWISDVEHKSFSSGFHFWPQGTMGLRYDKQVLLPIAEYIPLECCRELAKGYGITGSFTPGTGAKVFPGCKTPFGLSICYEEAYGDLMRQNRAQGANLLINLTSDVWYPDSKLPKQHFDHARLRTVENGIPLLRACNTGITAAIDSLGQVIGATSEKDEWVRQALYLQVPLYHYRTLYSLTGDTLIVGFSFLMALGLLRRIF